MEKYVEIDCDVIGSWSRREDADLERIADDGVLVGVAEIVGEDDEVYGALLMANGEFLDPDKGMVRVGEVYLEVTKK